MNIQYVSATPELKQFWKEQNPSNASDFIWFDDKYFSIIAMADERPVGLIVAKYRCLAKPLEMIKEAYIDIIEVHPDFQRCGIGTALMEKVFVWAKDNQLDQIRAWSEEIRFEALMMWKKLGFTFSRVDFQQGDEKRYGFYIAMKTSY